MTPREIKDTLYNAAKNNDQALALVAAQEFYKQKLWTSTPHYSPIEPDGSEVNIIAKMPGTCVLCNVEFKVNEPIRWRSRVDCHVRCWDNKFMKELVNG